MWARLAICLILSKVIAFFEALLFEEDVVCGLYGKYSCVVAYLGQRFDYANGS